jgi:flagellar hook-basal body complex protein FliE
MDHPISPLTPSAPLVRPTLSGLDSLYSLHDLSAAKPPAAPEGSFEQMFLQAITRTGQMEGQAQFAVQEALTGGDVTQVEVLSAVKKADLAMRLLLQVRNKVLDAYNEIQQMRM